MRPCDVAMRRRGPCTVPGPRGDGPLPIVACDLARQPILDVGVTDDPRFATDCSTQCRQPGRAQIPAVCRALHQLTSDYELLIVDDASSAEQLGPLTELLATVPQMQILRLDRPCGLSAALTAGINAAQGNCLVNLPAGNQSATSLIEPLLDGLVRTDLVVGRPRRVGWRKTLHRLIRIPRWFILGLEVRDPECQVWAARREALDGLHLPRGMYRYLATIVSARGFRVAEITVPTSGRSVQLSDGLANPGDLMAAWWLEKRWKPYEVARVQSPAAPRTTSSRQPASAVAPDREGPASRVTKPWRRIA